MLTAAWSPSAGNRSRRDESDCAKRRKHAGTIEMKLTNDSYLVLISTKNFTERYYRDKTGWLKVSARGRKFRMTAEQVLNHLLPALAGIKPNLTIKVEHRESVSEGK